MNKRLLSFLFVFAVAFIAFMQISYSNKNFAPTGRTNAPGESNCTQGCHSSYALQTTMGDRITITADGTTMDDNFTYTKGQTYAMNISISNAPTRNGFSLTLLNESNTFVGNLSTSDINADTIIAGNGREYVGHTNSLGVNSWSFSWTAPSDSQVITLYNVVNLTNNNNGTNGDSILTKQITFTAEPSTPSAIRDVALTDIVTLINPALNNNIDFTIDVKEASNYQAQLFDLSGAKVFDKNYFMHNGLSHVVEPVSVTSGLYILKLKTGNKFSSYKVVF